MRRAERFWVLLFTAFCLPLSAKDTPVQTWEQFRKVYPFHVQTTAITERAADGTRVLIVSEPPPHVTLRGLTSLGSGQLSSATTQKQQMGYDGWVKDVVVELAPLKDPELLELLDKVQEYLFGTTYKAETMALPAVPPPVTSVPLDVRVTSADLRRWFVKERLPLQGLGDRGPTALPDLLAQGKEGVYLGTQPGVVVWVLPRSGEYSRYRREARQFALDSDLIVGAIAGQTHMAVIARERLIPLNVMPPLRTETILQVADARGDSLEQSYQRMYILAGRIQDRTDWAPIYLSNELVDSEYGSLLNLTDQMLKSWSNGGQLDYINFHYPKPRVFPFPHPLPHMPDIRQAMDDSGEGLTYNWNTRGAGYVDNLGGFKIYALNRTGALPISYSSGDANVSSYEKTAYSWFAGQTKDPNLARVVQYAALYQMFHEFRNQRGPAKPVANKQPNVERLTANVQTTLESIRKDECDARALARHDVEDSELHRLMQLLGIGGLEHSCELINSLYEEYQASGLSALAATLTAVAETPADQQLVLSVFTRPKEGRDAFVDALPVEKRMRLEALICAQELSSDPGFRREVAKRIPLEKARDLIAAGVRRTEDAWVHTASIVASRPTGEMLELTGGHNVYSKVGQFVQDDTVKAGEVRVVRQGTERIVHYSPADQARLPELLRDEALQKNDATLASSLKASLRMPVDLPEGRTVDTALGIVAKRTERGLDPLLGGTGRPAMFGWGSASEMTPAETRFLEQVQGKASRTLRVERAEDGNYRVLEAQGNRVYQAHSMTDAIDVVVTSLKRAPSPPPVTMMVAGMDDTSAVNFRRSIEIKIQADGLPPRRVPAILLKDESNVDPVFQKVMAEGDLTRARFGEWKAKEALLSSGKQGKVFETTIEIPPKLGAIRTILLRIRIFIDSLFSMPQDTAAVNAQLLKSLTALPEDARAADAAAALEKDLKLRFRNLDSIIFETADMKIAQRNLFERQNAQ